MNSIPLQIVIFGLPTLLYATIRRWQGEGWAHIFVSLGLRASPPIYFIGSLGVVATLLALTLLLNRLMPSDIYQRPGIGTSYYRSWKRGAVSFLLAWLRETIYVALWEEVFFRGLLGGWLMRRFGFWVGNGVQTMVSFLPHLLVLLAGTDLWPLLVVPLLGGWLTGVLRYRSDSILPGLLSHSLANAVAAILAMEL